MDEAAAKPVAAWKKWLGYAVLSVFVAGMLGLVYYGGKIFWLAIRAHDMPGLMRTLMFLVAGLLWCIPGIIAFRLLKRRWRTGSFKLSPEEKAAAVAKCKTPKPLKTRIWTAAAWLFSAVIWTDLAVHGRHPGGIKWLLVVVYWFNAGMATWQVFRSRSCAMPEPAAETMLNLNH
jgi:hypothetical protein